MKKRKLGISILLAAGLISISSCGDQNQGDLGPDVIQSFTVTFEGVTNSFSENVTLGDKVKKPETPTMDNFIFDQWYEDSAFTKPYDFDSPVTSNLTLYAKWINANVFNKDMLEQNLEKEEETNSNVIEYAVTNLKGYISFDESSKTKIYNDNYYKYGLIITKNEAGYIGFYSLQYNNYLVAPMYFEEWIQDLTILTDEDSNGSNIGYYIRIRYEDEYTIYDSMGNIVKVSEEKYKPVTTEINDAIYLTLFDEDGDPTSYFKYSSEGKLETVSYLPEEIVEEEREEIKEDDDKLDFGDIFVNNEVDLSDFGMTGMYLVSSNNLYTVFDANDKKVSTFTLPEDVKPVLIENSLVYQIYTPLPDEAENYSFSSMMWESVPTKYSLNTYAINLQTGVKTELDCSYVVEGAAKYKNKQGVYEYALARLYRIGGNKELYVNAETCLINVKGQIVQNLSGYEVYGFTRLEGGNYYNTQTKVLYNSSLNELAYIGDMNPRNIEKSKMFIGQMDGLWGAVDYNGKVIIPFEYTNLYPLEQERTIDIKNNCLIVSKYLYNESKEDYETRYYRFNISNGYEEFLGTNISYVYEDLYMVKSGSQYKYISQDKDYTTITFDNTYTEADRNVNKIFTCKFNNCKYVFTRSYDYIKSTNDNDLDYIKDIKKVVYNIFTINDYPNKEYTTIGEEYTGETKLGITQNNSYVMVLGENDINVCKDQTHVYYQYTPTKDSCYLIKSKDKLIISVTDIYGNSISVKEESLSYNNNYYYFNLEKNEKYFIKFTINETENHYAKYDFSMVEAGFKYTPLELDYENLSGVVNQGDFDYAYVHINTLNVEPDLLYEIKVSDNVEFDVLGSTVTSSVISYGKTSYNFSFSDDSFYIRVYSTSTTKSDYTVSLKQRDIASILDNNDKPLYADGDTILNPIALKKDGEQKIDPETGEGIVDVSGNPVLEVANDLSIAAGKTKYYSYTNEDENPTSVSFNIKSFKASTTTSQYIYYKAYAEDFTILSSTYGSSFTKTYFLQPGETIYICLSNTYNYNYNVDVEIEPNDEFALPSEEIKLNKTYNLTFDETGIKYYKFMADYEATKGLIESITDQTNGTLTVKYYDEDYTLTSLDSLEEGKIYYAEFYVIVSAIADEFTCKYSLKDNFTELTSVETSKTISSSYDYQYAKYINNTNSDKLIRITSSLVNSFGNNSGYTVYMQVESDDGKFSASYNSTDVEPIIIVPAKTTYYVTYYTANYVSNGKLKIKATECATETNKRLTINSGKADYQVFRCTKNGYYGIYTTNMNYTSQSVTLYRLVGNKLVSVTNSSNTNSKINLLMKTELYKDEIYVVKYNNNSSYNVSFVSIVKEIN